MKKIEYACPGAISKLAGLLMFLLFSSSLITDHFQVSIRRLTYPTSELSVNTTNVNAAISSQGPDVLSTRVWRDK